MKCLLALAAVAAASLCLAAAPADAPKIGGENSPDPSPPLKLAVETQEFDAGGFSIRIPKGDYTAPKGGAANYTVPGPIVSFKGADGVWRGHGYLETYPRLLKLERTQALTQTENGGGVAFTFTYTFENDKTYKATLRIGNGLVLIDEESTLGPRNIWVFDCYYGNGAHAAWTPSTGVAFDAAADKHAFIYLPCYYDKPEVTINPAAVAAKSAPKKPPADASIEDGGAKDDKPAADARGVAVLSPDAAKKDIAAFWVLNYDQWKNPDAMGIQLWQRRQLPGDPASRHFLGPETKSDSTPNPRTAGLLGKSLYEGHVTVELNLGVGSRKLAFTAAAKGATKPELIAPLQKIMQANLKAK